MTYLATPLLIILAIFAFFMYGTPDAQLVTVNGTAVRDLSTIVSLTNSQDVLTSTRYDSFEIPRGTNYRVPAGYTFYITHLEGEPGNVGGFERISIGYSTETVDNRVAIPTGSGIMFDVTLNAAKEGLDHQEIFVPIPELMYPWIQIEGAGNVQATGFLRKTY